MSRARTARRSVGGNRLLRERIAELEADVERLKDDFSGAAHHFYLTYMAGNGWLDPETGEPDDDLFVPPSETPWIDVAKHHREMSAAAYRGL